MACMNKSGCGSGKPVETKRNVPDPGAHTPDGNVNDDGQCTVAPDAESARPGTGEPCIDAQNEPAMRPRS